MKRIKFKIIYVPLFLMLVIGALMIGLTDYLTAQFTADTITQFHQSASGLSTHYMERAKNYQFVKKITFYN